MIGAKMNKRKSRNGLRHHPGTRIFLAMRRRGSAKLQDIYIYIMYGKRNIF